jgi:hypothetical protein
MASLFAGAILLYKNPQSQRNVPTEAADAAEVIGLQVTCCERLTGSNRNPLEVPNHDA